jgi:hypothetical protein
VTDGGHWATKRSEQARSRTVAIGVIRVEGGLIAELIAFHDTGLFKAFGLPMTFPPADVSTGVRDT